MTLRRRTIAVMVGASAIAMAILYASSRVFWLSHFSQLDQDHTQENVERVLSQLSDDLAAMNITARDWAGWDATYAYVQDLNDAYVTGNLDPVALINLRLNLLLFASADGGDVWGQAVDLGSGSNVPVPESVRAHLAANDRLLRHADPESSMTGVILLPEGPLLVASQPIVTSQRQGPVRGTLIIGRFLDAAAIEALAASAHVALTVYRLDDAAVPLDIQTVQASLSSDLPVLVRSTDKQSLTGYALLPDAYGVPALVLKVAGTRESIQRGQELLGNFTLFLLAAFLALAAAILIHLDRSVLSRVAYLNDRVGSIGAGGDLAARVNETGRDEISSLAVGINEMLAALEQTQSARLAARARLEYLLAHSPVAIYSREPQDDGPLTSVSDSVETLLGYDGQAFLADPAFWSEHIHPDDAPGVRSALLCASESGRQDRDYRFRHLDGSYRWLRDECRLVPDAAGEPLEVVGTWTDITARVRAEEALRDYSERLEDMVAERTEALKAARERMVRREKLAALGQMAGSVSHELRNPLGVISNALYVLNMLLPDAEPGVREHLDMVAAEVQHSEKIVHDLLDSVRIRPSDRRPIAVTELVAQVLAAGSVPENVQVVVQVSSDLPAVCIDAQQIVQVLTNLVTNAWQAMPDGGQLTIAAHHVPGASPHTGEAVAISVSDTGIGISAENMDKLFEPLFTTKDKGTGLGLAICRSLVDANGGSIEVDSTEGKGSVFAVSLPTRLE
jgi:PAS domain S-box-containing protein